MKFPKLLQDKNTIGLVSLSSPAPLKNINKGIHILEKLGFQIKLGQSTFNKTGYIAGSAEDRAQDFIKMWQDPEVDAIFCTRGGYGSMQIIPYLNPSQLLATPPKIILGCSDLTALFLYLQKLKIVCFHGPFVATEQFKLRENQESLLKMLSQKKFSHSFSYQSKVFREGLAKGVIIGGNLTMIAHSLGTPYEIQTENKILFIEDVGEKIYRLDRMMYQLLHAEKLSKLRGIILGDFENCGESEERKAFFRQFFQKHILPRHPNIPIIEDLKAGHGKWNFTFPLGYPVKFVAREHGVRFQLLESPLLSCVP